MPVYNDLTADQKAAVDNLSALVRDTVSKLAKVCNAGRAVSAGYVGNVESILATLDSGAVIPNTTGLAGAQPMTRSELVTVIGYLMVMSETADGASGSLNTNYHKSLYAKACGPVNLIG